MVLSKKICSTILALVLICCVLPLPQAHATDASETLFFVEDLGNGITVETTIEIFPGVTRNSSTSAVLPATTRIMEFGLLLLP